MNADLRKESFSLYAESTLALGQNRIFACRSAEPLAQIRIEVFLIICFLIFIIEIIHPFTV